MNGIITGIDYWNIYFQNNNLPNRFTFTNNPVNANIIISVDPSLVGSGFGANNQHGQWTGAGTIYLNPEYLGGIRVDYIRTVIAHELGHSIGFDDKDDVSGACPGLTIMYRPIDPRFGPFWSLSTTQDECNVQQERTFWPRQPPPPPPQPGGGCFGTCGDSFGEWEPLVLDLDGEGVYTTGIDQMVWFDLDGDGVKEHITWINSRTMEAFLWVNLSGRKITVDNGGELFGVGTTLPDGSKAKDGFEALAMYDRISQGGNADGLIDKRDAVWNKLWVWIDANHDGICEPTETGPLHRYGIEGISLAAIPNTEIDDQGNGHSLKSHYWRHSGNAIQVFDIDGLTFRVERTRTSP